MLCFFFYKQKTAYERRISDWSSDVCSSDLNQPPALLSVNGPGEGASLSGNARSLAANDAESNFSRLPMTRSTSGLAANMAESVCAAHTVTRMRALGLARCARRTAWRGSEEHTSELTSPMRISSPVFV